MELARSFLARIQCRQGKKDTYLARPGISPAIFRDGDEREVSIAEGFAIIQMRFHPCSWLPARICFCQIEFST
jgi:hypothetical protein